MCLCVFQIGQTNNVIDNMHTIIAAAAVKFDSGQLENLFLLIQKVSIVNVKNSVIMILQIL